MNGPMFKPHVLLLLLSVLQMLGCSTVSRPIIWEYREIADLFNFVDCASEWPGFDHCSARNLFRKYLETHGGTTAAPTDLELLSNYAQIRKNNFGPTGLFKIEQSSEGPSLFASSHEWANDPFLVHSMTPAIWRRRILSTIPNYPRTKSRCFEKFLLGFKPNLPLERLGKIISTDWRLKSAFFCPAKGVWSFLIS